MSDAAHARWQAIVATETLGEAISAEDREFRGDFEAAHPACAAETAAWGALLGALDPGESEGTGSASDDGGDALAARILAAARGQTAGAASTPTPSISDAAATTAVASITAVASTGAASAPVLPLAPRSRRRGFALVGGIAVITAAAASLALLWRSPEVPDGGPIGGAARTPTPTAPKIADADPPKRPDAPSIAPAGAPISEAIVVAMTAPGGLRIDGELRSVGMSLGEGATLRAEAASCLLFRDPFAAVCLGAGAEATISAAHAGVRELALGRGRVVAALDPMGPGQSFTVTTAAGDARAIGTVFAVEVAGQAIDVGVVEGKIEVRGAGAGRPHRLVAGERTTMADPAATSPLTGEFDTWSKGQADLAELWRDLGDPAGSARLAVDGAAGVAVAIDGVSLPDRAPLELLIGAGEHEVSARGPRGGPRLRTIVGDPAAPTRLTRGELLARAPSPGTSSRPPPAGDPGSEPTPPTTPPAATTPTIAELRRSATQARGERRWQDAATAYRTLIDAYPAAPEADNARYQLGDLLRARLGRPEDALALFDAYLARGGPLAAEARLGKIRSLQALGRAADEAAAIAEYLAEHPDHLEVEKFRQRARELAGR